jgi:acetoin utilization deacetylase AcuC-like enzyme
MTSIGFVYDDFFAEHRTPSGHPERPDRLRWLVRHLQECGRWGHLRHIKASAARLEEVLQIHSEGYLEFVHEVCRRGGGMLDEGDTYASAHSWDAALLAAGAVIKAVDGVLGGEVAGAFCAVRPPGHHAEQDRASGFCLLNNVAIGARYAQRRHGIANVAILDWDVHHGNGTQHAFEEDPTVFYVSTHQYPFFPGSGSRQETGRGRGEGATLNIPLSAGADEERYLLAFHEEIIPALQRFNPGLLIISAGFDAHREDPLGEMALTEDSFAAFTRLLRGIAPIVSVLEGGYSLGALARSVERHLGALGGEPAEQGEDQVRRRL